MKVRCQNCGAIYLRVDSRIKDKTGPCWVCNAKVFKKIGWKFLPEKKIEINV